MVKKCRERSTKIYWCMNISKIKGTINPFSVFLNNRQEEDRKEMYYDVKCTMATRQAEQIVALKFIVDMALKSCLLLL